MQSLFSHFRNKLLAGALAAVPIVVLVSGAVIIDEYTRPLALPVGVYFPGLGVVIALVLVYVLGLFVTSLLGRWSISTGDWVLQRIPGLKLVYLGLKDVLVVQQGEREMLRHVVMVPSAGGSVGQLGFTNGQPVGGDPNFISVFLPNTPNPLFGRLVVARRDHCQFLKMTLEDAFKYLVSSGNYEPSVLQGLPPRDASPPSLENPIA